MRPARIVVVASLCAAPIAALAGPAQAAAAFDPGRPVQLAWDTVPGLDHLSSLGAAPATQLLHVQVAFRDPDTSAELANLAGMYTPGSANFHHFLTPAEIGSRYGTAPAAVADATERLTDAGMTIDFRAATGDVVAAHGTVAAVERAFHVTEQRYSYNGTDFIANTTGPTVMSGDQVGTVVGLDTLARFHTPTLSKAAQAKLRAQKPQDDNGDAFAFDDSSPDALRAAYDMPKTLTAAGQGQRIAIIGDGDTAVATADLRGFEANFRKHDGSTNDLDLPDVPVQTHCPEPDATTGQPSCGPDDADGDGEWDIDFQASTGMAPHLDALEPYFAQSIYDADLNYAFLGWINDPDAPLQASASLGECEETPLNGVWTGPLEPIDGNGNPDAPAVSIAMGNDEEALLDTALMHAAEQGKTLFASTGDAGGFCNVVYPPTNLNGVVYGGDPSPEYPAASAFAVAVGGTVLFTNDGAPGPEGSATTGSTSRLAEYAWEYTGGGTSSFEPAWTYQTGNGHAYSNVTFPCLSSASATGPDADTGVQCRGLPDVAAQSGDVYTENGYDIYTGGSMCDGCGGGTSLSSPLWVGMWARIQSSNPSPGGFGYANPLLYALGENATTYARDFTDVTEGDNGSFAATPGWDYVSGFGTPNVAAIIADAPTADTTGLVGSDLPEAPMPALLAIGAALATATIIGVRRRRRSSAAIG